VHAVTHPLAVHQLAPGADEVSASQLGQGPSGDQAQVDQVGPYPPGRLVGVGGLRGHGRDVGEQVGVVDLDEVGPESFPPAFHDPHVAGADRLEHEDGVEGVPDL